MLRRPWPIGLAIAVGALGLVLILAGVAVTWVWVPGDDGALRYRGSGNAPVVTAPGLLDLGGEDVVVTVAAGGAPRVFVGVARAAEVDAYLERAARQEVVGIRSDGAPLSRVRSGTGDLPSAEDVDIWAEQAVGSPRVRLTWRGSEHEGRWRLLAVPLAAASTPPRSAAGGSPSPSGPPTATRPARTGVAATATSGPTARPTSTPTSTPTATATATAAPAARPAATSTGASPPAPTATGSRAAPPATVELRLDWGSRSGSGAGPALLVVGILLLVAGAVSLGLLLTRVRHHEEEVP